MISTVYILLLDLDLYSNINLIVVTRFKKRLYSWRKEDVSEKISITSLTPLRLDSTQTCASKDIFRNKTQLRTAEEHPLSNRTVLC